MLKAALHTYQAYCRRGISPNIFVETMSCFTRFVLEHKASFGEYGFDREWWTYRQLSMTLFKIGELEYEFRDDEKTIHIHIPTGASIDLISCRNSYIAMREFTEKYEILPPERRKGRQRKGRADFLCRAVKTQARVV